MSKAAEKRRFAGLNGPEDNLDGQLAALVAF